LQFTEVLICAPKSLDLKLKLCGSATLTFHSLKSAVTLATTICDSEYFKINFDFFLQLNVLELQTRA